MLLCRVGRAGLLGAFWCASPFPLAALSFCFAWPPPGWGCPSPGCLLLFFFSFPFLCCFFPCAPFVSCILWFPAPGALGLGASCCLFCSPRASWIPVRSRFFLFCPAVFFLPSPPPLSPSFFGLRPWVPWASALCVVCFVGLPLLGSRCALSFFVLFAWPLAAPGWLLPPPPSWVSRFSSLSLGAVCRVLCCPVCPWVRCCAALLRVVPPGVVLSCAVLLCCARLVQLLVAPCPLALPVALGPCALWPCVLRCSPAHCALCCVFFVVARWCVLLFAALLPAVLCVPRPLHSVRCCASLCWCACVVLFVWCVLLLAPGAVVRCCVSRCFLWWPVVVCWWRVSVSVSLSDCVVCFPVVGVVCCGALLSSVVFCGALLPRGAVLLCSAVVLLCCWGLLRSPVACRAVLCCAVGWLCCFLSGGGVCVLWCSFPRAVRSLSSPLCALRCLIVLAVVSCFPVSCAVALCCRVVLCCRALLSFCSAVCVWFALLRPVVRRRAVPCCAVRCLCCFLPGGGVCVLWCPFPPCLHAQKTSIIIHVTPCWWRCRDWHALVVAVSWT